MPAGMDVYNYQKAKNFWWGDNALQAEFDALKSLVPFSGNADEPEIDMFRLAHNLYYDLYNNGGGHDHRFDIGSSLNSVVNAVFNNFNGSGHEKAGVRILMAFHDVWMSMDRTEWFPKNDQATQLLVEVFMTEVVYAASEHRKLSQLAPA